MNNFFRNYFSFNRRERKGLIILSAVVVSLLLWLFAARLFTPEFTTDLTVFEKEIDHFDSLKNITMTDSVNADEHFEDDHKFPVSLSNPVPERFYFDPNDLPEADWKRLGFSDKQIRTIKNYESKGGRFRKKEDVRKMYCISTEIYTSLEPYIRISQNNKVDSTGFAFNKNTNEKRRDTIYPKRKPLYFELNSADTTDLNKLKGIGSTFAKRIVNYRYSLGGFVNKEQLLEVYGFDREKLDLVTENIFVDSLLIEKMNINTASFDALRKHPYIKYNLAKVIVNYREQHGAYKSLADLRKLAIITDEVYRKISHYLDVK